MYQLYIDLKKAYDLFRKETFNNILIEFGIPKNREIGTRHQGPTAPISIRALQPLSASGPYSPYHHQGLTAPMHVGRNGQALCVPPLISLVIYRDAPYQTL
jgi:hypothetical protein